MSSPSDQLEVESRQPEVTPASLIRRFCGAGADGLVAGWGTTETDGIKKSRGHCGYIGGRGDSLVVGFQDGCDFMDYLSERGWVLVHDKGSWPYLVYLVWRSGEKRAIIEYCEGDLTLWEFPTEAQAREFADTLS